MFGHVLGLPGGDSSP